MNEALINLKERMAELSDEELYLIVNVDFSNYRQEAIDLAKAELEKRGYQGHDPSHSEKKEPSIDQIDFGKTDTTRYLSAAAYYDSAFCDQVVERVVEEEIRAVVASYGVDLATVAKHCLIARTWKISRDIKIAPLFLLSVVLWNIEPASIVIPLFIVWLILYLRSRNIYLTTASFSKEAFDPEVASFKIGSGAEARLERIAHEQRGNVVVYSGFSPFVGSGFDVGGWSFTIKINKGKEESGKKFQAISFDLAELYDYLAYTITALGLDGLCIEDKLFVDGQEIRNDKRFLHNPFVRPNTNVDPLLVKSFIDACTPHIRFYKCVKVISWKGEIVLTIFIRFAKVNNNLFAEASYFLLPPLKDTYHEVDAMNPTLTTRKEINLAVTAAIKAPFLLAFSPILAYSHVTDWYRRRKRRREIARLIEENFAFDYGANTSVRESVTSSQYRRYFQKLDQAMNFKLVERQILDGIIEFLDKKNIDTSDLKERQTTILNNGVIISGGAIRAESLAVGKRAMSQISRLAEAASSAVEGTPQKITRSQQEIDKM
jgi:hypothetical protein